MKHLTRILFISMFLSLTAQVTLSQTLALPGDGKDFWVGYMYPSYNKVANATTEGFYGAFLLISSYTQNSVGVFYFDRTTGVETQAGQYSIPERTGIQVPIEIANVKMNDTGDIPEYAAIHITALRAINVEFFSTGACAGGSFLPITTAGLGNKYVVASYYDNPGDLGILGNGSYNAKYIEISEGFFEIIAPYNNTQVKITPNSTTMGGHPGFHSGANKTFPNKVPYTVTLQRGQCYLVKSASDDNSDDISGSLIESTHPIAVIGGHENAALGGVSNRALEGRDFMVEQMYPVDMWDTTGYVMVPLRDSQPDDPNQFEGVGENYRTYTFDNGTNINMYNSCVSGAIDMSTGQLAQPAPEQIEITCPVDFEGVPRANGQPQNKFSVMMYDLRNFANSAPYPAPSMITVIPMSRWRTSFLWYVPANKFEILQGYYVDIIGQTPDFDGPNGIQASFNGGPIRPIKTILSTVKSWKGIIPNYPTLSGLQFKLNPGSYYAHGPHPFMVYNFGFRALDPNFDLGDFDGDDYFFSYGLPVGMKLGGVPHLRITVDTSCSSWNVCVHDSTLGLTNQGIKSVTLMDDPTGDQFDVHPGRQFYNTRLDDSLDPDHTNEINLSGDDSDFCFKVLVNVGTDSAYAPLFIVDDQGGAVMLELRYKQPLVTLKPDTGSYLALQLNKDSCINFVFKNIAKKGADPTANAFHLGAVALKHNTPGFRINSITPNVPTTILAGDSVVINACYTAVDTFIHRDTIQIGTDCFNEPVPLVGSGAIPIIWASDHDFGNVVVDSTKCDTVGVYNIGKYPFTLNSQWFLANYGTSLKFQLDPTDSAKLANPGIILKPGQKYLFHFCYTPTDEIKDSATQHWGTTLEAPFQHSNKDTSLLLGKGVRTGFVWDRVKQDMNVECQNSQTVRVNLLNNAAPGGPPAHVNKVFFTGPNAADFTIVGNTSGFTPLGNFDLYPAPPPSGQMNSIGVDVVFQPQGVPADYSVRHAQLVASGPGEKDQVIDFTGEITHAAPHISPLVLNFGQVVLGQPYTQTTLISDSGTADAIIDCIKNISYPIVSVTGVNLGDTILHGADSLNLGKRVTITMALNDYTDTSVDLIFCYKTACTQEDTVHIIIAASFINPSNTGHNYDSVFLDCRHSLDSVTAFNKGTRPLTLQRIDIIKDDTLKGGSSIPGEFAFGNGTQTLDLLHTPGADTIFGPNSHKSYAVTFNPTVEGWDTVIVRCTWDSAGVKILTSSNLLIGYGRLERETFAPIQAVIPPKVTGSTIDVPIMLVDTLPADVNAKGVTFTVTYDRDLLDIHRNSDGTVKADLNSGLSYFAGKIPSASPNQAAGTESVTFNLQSNVGAITMFTPSMLTMHFDVMVAKQVQTPITISNAVFWGTDPTDTLCYVINSYDSANFKPAPSCGDTTLRQWLGDIFPTRIVAISPNPVVNASNPVVDYQINIDNAPVTIEIFNALGEKVRTVAKDVVQKKGEYLLPLGARDLGSGMYVVRFTSMGYVESGDFVIQK